MKHGKASFQIFILKNFLSPRPHSQANFQYLLHQFASHFSLAKLNLNSTFIVFEFNSIIYEFQFNSSSMQCHPIFSFKWNLISKKSIPFLHQLINRSSLIGHFCGEFLAFGNKKKDCELSKGCFGNNNPKLAHFEEKMWNSSYLDHRFLYVNSL